MGDEQADGTARARAWCRRTSCPWCGWAIGYITSIAAASAKPDFMITITQPGETYETISRSLTTFKRCIVLDGSVLNWIWAVERFASGVPHVHGFAHGDVSDNVLERAAAKSKVGGVQLSPSSPQPRHGPAMYLFTSFLGHPRGSREAIEGLSDHLTLNHGRLHHGVRFFRDPDGIPIAKAEALRLAHAGAESVWDCERA